MMDDLWCSIFDKFCENEWKVLQETQQELVQKYRRKQNVLENIL